MSAGPSPGRAAFFACLRDEWAPELRRLGFKGSGQRFYRDTGEVVHAIGVQVNKYGGSCCVNLGAHPRCLPLSPDGAVESGRRVRAEGCEFRWRLTPEGQTDFWWGYEAGIAAHLPYGMTGGGGVTPEDRARDLMRLYRTAGEPVLQRLTRTTDFLPLIRIADIERGHPISPRYLYTPARAALTMARLHMHLGDADTARRFAEAGLEHIGRAKGLRSALEELARA